MQSALQCVKHPNTMLDREFKIDWPSSSLSTARAGHSGYALHFFQLRHVVDSRWAEILLSCKGSTIVEFIKCTVFLAASASQSGVA